MSPKKSKTEAGQLFLEKVGFKLYNVPSKMYQETFLVEFMSYYEFLLCTSYLVHGTSVLVPGTPLTFPITFGSLIFCDSSLLATLRYLLHEQVASRPSDDLLGAAHPNRLPHPHIDWLFGIPRAMQPPFDLLLSLDFSSKRTLPWICSYSIARCIC